jgi:hypothetical protein
MRSYLPQLCASMAVGPTCFVYWECTVEIRKRGHSKKLVKKQPEGCFLRDTGQHAQILLYNLHNTTSTCISVLPEVGSTP